MDEFNDPTGVTHSFTLCDGTFSNTATLGSDLDTVVYYDPNSGIFLFRLLEYTNTKATYSISSGLITIKCKVDDNIFDGYLFGEPPDGELVLSNNNDSFHDQFYSYLIEGKDIHTVIYIGNSKYNFTINGDGFAESLSNQRGSLWTE